ncbi:MAG: hypothetical protein ACRDZ1_05615 [Acidimicrobiia bacterium]
MPVALSERVEALAADRAFGAVPDLYWVDPATSALDDLLAR